MPGKLCLGVFASGRGSNFTAILEAIDRGDLDATVGILVSNHADAGAVATAESRGIPTVAVERSSFDTSDDYSDFLIEQMEQHSVNLIVLAGYMKKIPTKFIARFKNRIVNIHPALLPDFGGQGMYGIRVHRAVIESGASVSGATIHLVDEEYDRGPIIAQSQVPVLPGDTPEILAARVLETEHKLYPETLRRMAKGFSVEDGAVKFSFKP